jgi:hypothetical protein
MKLRSFYLVLVGIILAQLQVQASVITLKGPQGAGIIASLTSEILEFHETIGVGLSDTRYDNIGYVDFSSQVEKTISVEHIKPIIVNLTIAPKPGKTFQARTYLLYLQPEEQLTVEINNEGKPLFKGVNASRQEFLAAYFLENHYQFLPALGYRPDAPEFGRVEVQIDSLQKLRTTALKEYKSNTPSSEDVGFSQYILARMMTEPYLLKTFIEDKKMRQGRAVRLSNAQRQELDEFTINNFKVLGDEALLSKAYRDELRHWIHIPVKQKFPGDSLYQIPVNPSAIADIFRLSTEKLSDYPEQKKYLLTYWLNHASTALNDPKIAAILLNEYKGLYPDAKETIYYDNLITAKSKLQKGAPAPDLSLLKSDSSAFSLSSLQGKPVCLVFAFNIKQFENDLKSLETKYSGKVQFIYATVSPAIPYGFWKKNTNTRSGIIHLWASPDQTEQIKQKYVTEVRYPFVVIDRSVKIHERWIPQQFPSNEALEKALIQVANN